VRPRRPRHAQIHLPSLTGEQAFLLAALLDRAVAAIWRAHGDDIADFQGRAFPDDVPPRGAVDVGDRHPDERDGDDLF
jgi:hypothetical protein